jgi:hypothetical protein
VKLIPEARKAWRMFSVQMASIILIWSTLPADSQAAVLGLVGVPSDAVTGILAVLVILGRLIDQPKTRA